MNTDAASKMSHSGHKETKANSPIHQERPASSVPSCVSMKSDWSMERLIDFREEPYSPIHQERPVSSVPSCVSMKCDWSMGQPLHFKEGGKIDHQKRSESNILSGQTAQSHLTHLSSIFSSLEQNIMTFIKKELKRFKTMLSSDLPECFEAQRKDEEVVDSEDGKQESSAKEGALKITLHFLRNMNQEQLAYTLEENVCDLTLDPNTVHRNLCLSEENRKLTRSKEIQLYPDHPERFDIYEQVLCREGLTGRCYWEVEWSGRGADIAVTYKGINRRGGYDCGLGYNDESWSLYFYDNKYSACHNNKMTALPVPPSGSHRVGVYLDWPAGTLSFYRVSSDTLTHLYTFNATFTEPLYPGFRIYYYDSFVSLCQLV
ncbi:hypothetical protein UPYG_G00092940 [Umbra pygmaea]|uniref:B30.2/SPRY domain-containing protein n=1 Tax=Umbra pygmaea TaxID=75934 RepID=A0ABD0XP14_UMBPY